MKKLFISQPMNGRSDEEILEEREQAVISVQILLGEKVEVLDTIYNDMPADAKPLDYISRSISDLAKADIAYFCKGWEKACGCRIEHETAVGYNIPLID